MDALPNLDLQAPQVWQTARAGGSDQQRHSRAPDFSTWSIKICRTGAGLADGVADPRRKNARVLRWKQRSGVQLHRRLAIAVCLVYENKLRGSGHYSRHIIAVAADSERFGSLLNQLNHQPAEPVHLIV